MATFQELRVAFSSVLCLPTPILVTDRGVLGFAKSNETLWAGARYLQKLKFLISLSYMKSSLLRSRN